MKTETEKRLLKVGDRVYRKDYPQWHSLEGYYNYISATVERLTKTQAVLSNGVKLINDPVNGAGWGERSYIDAWPIYGDKWEKYLLETPQSAKEGAIQKERIKIHRWFADKKFTEEEKRKIYHLLNSQQ